MCAVLPKHLRPFYGTSLHPACQSRPMQVNSYIPIHSLTGYIGTIVCRAGTTFVTCKFGLLHASKSWWLGSCRFRTIVCSTHLGLPLPVDRLYAGSAKYPVFPCASPQERGEGVSGYRCPVGSDYHRQGPPSNIAKSRLDQVAYGGLLRYRSLRELLLQLYR